MSQAAPDHVRVAGLMHEPEDGSPVVMAGLMGMVKLFVRNGVQVVADVMRDYQALMRSLGTPDKSIAVAIVHHANYKINQLKAEAAGKEGIRFPMPWLLSEFGNVSAASNMIAFLRQLPQHASGRPRAVRRLRRRDVLRRAGCGFRNLTLTPGQLAGPNCNDERRRSPPAFLFPVRFEPALSPRRPAAP